MSVTHGYSKHRPGCGFEENEALANPVIFYLCAVCFDATAGKALHKYDALTKTNVASEPYYKPGMADRQDAPAIVPVRDAVWSATSTDEIFATVTQLAPISNTISAFNSK